MLIQKRPFILIEVFIAIALLTLCAFPLISSSLHSYRRQKEQLLMLELERQAELYFYQVLKEKVGDLDYDSIPSQTSTWIPFKELELSLGEIKQVYYPHYHLYYMPNLKSKTHKTVWCEICFPTKKNTCPKKPYKFVVLVKKVAENSSDQHGNNKEKNIKNHEGSPSNIQTIRSSE
ncbi:MAG: hypothetical protein H7A41_03145 [Chlamydiales bacterium]|nr:hypothetical protein [Chlamydiia bacterium]MCP5504130.1 hypothetical protein [Chlamydiales bacterium]